MVRRATAWLAAALGLVTGPAAAGDRLDVTGMLDLRLVSADAATAYQAGGLGPVRFDSDHQGLRLGRAFIAARWRLSDTWTANVVADAYGDGDKDVVGVSQAYVEWRPFPRRALRWRARLGAFFPPVSLEHRMPGWTSPYTLSASAINTWIGEEFRVLGAEVEARWLGAAAGYRGDVGLVAGVYGWNDPAGAVIADRGWALTDRASLLFSGLGRPRTDLYHELDGRPGYYAGVTWRHGDQLEVRALHYDNRADPGAASRDLEFAWDTRYSSVGVRYEPTEYLTLLAQHLEGVTYVGPDAAGPRQFEMRLESWFGLASLEWGRHRLSARFDHFTTRQNRGFYDEYAADNAGHALTVAWLERLGAHWELAAEWLRVRSAFPPRADSGLPVAATDRQLQLALRYRFRLAAG